MTDTVDRMARAGYAWQAARQGLRLRWEDDTPQAHTFYAAIAGAVLCADSRLTDPDITAGSIACAMVELAELNGRPLTGVLSWGDLPEHCRQYFLDLAAAMLAVPL